MGYFSTLFNNVEKVFLEQYGIKTPSDVLKFFDRLVSSDMDNEEKIKLAKKVVSWLKKREPAGDRDADSARDVLKELRQRDKLPYKYKYFFKNNKINL